MAPGGRQERPAGRWSRRLAYDSRGGRTVPVEEVTETRASSVPDLRSPDQARGGTGEPSGLVTATDDLGLSTLTPLGRDR